MTGWPETSAWGRRRTGLIRAALGGGALIALLLTAGCSGKMDPTIAELIGTEDTKPQPNQTEEATGQSVPAPQETTFEMPRWSVGDEWRYSDGYGFQVETVNGDLTRFRRTDDVTQWFESRGLFRERSQSASTLREVVFRSEDPALLYSAEPGQAVVFVREYLSNGRLVRHRTSWTVEGTDRITVPAGTFDCLILVKRSRSLTGTWTGYERIWFSPAAKNYVRMEFKYGAAPDGARVLTSYNVAS